MAVGVLRGLVLVRGAEYECIWGRYRCRYGFGVMILVGVCI